MTPRVGDVAEAESQTAGSGRGNPVIDAYNWAVQGRNNGEVDTPAEGQKNTALSAGAESTAVNINPALHTAAEQKTIAEYQSSVDETIKDFIDEYLENPNKGFSRKNISSVGERQASDAKSLLGGDYVGYKNAINSNAIKHILNEHGPNGAVDHSMSDANDIARVGYVLDNYDNVEVVEYASGDQDFSREFRDKNNNPAPMLKFSKKVNGTYYVVEAIPESQYKKFWVVSAYMQTDSGTQAPNANGPGNTPNASLASSLSAAEATSDRRAPGMGAVDTVVTSANNTIQQSAPGVNAESGTFNPVIEAYDRAKGVPEGGSGSIPAAHVGSTGIDDAAIRGRDAILSPGAALVNRG